MSRIKEVMYFATHEHVIKRGQLYSGVLPYTHHLEKVAQIVDAAFYPMQKDEDLVIAAWLHDMLEDCEGIKEKEIRERFGDRVADLVSAVTNEPGPNRKTRHALTYPKIRETPDAIILKLADRLANVTAGGSLVGMYRKEQKEFYQQLKEAKTSSEYHEMIANHLWTLLEFALESNGEK